MVSTGTFQIDYTQLHTRLFIDQAHTNTISGFLAKSTAGDPDWGYCLQCAAVDRARYKLSPVPPRSDFCAKCFTRYCFDPANPPDGSMIVGRKLSFVDPQPEGLSKEELFFSRNRFAFIGGLIIVVFIGENPFKVYQIIFSNALGDLDGWGNVLYRATPLIFTALAVALAFQCGLFNIGGEGQMVIGGFALTWVGFTFTGLPSVLLIPLCIVAGAAAGAGAGAAACTPPKPSGAKAGGGGLPADTVSTS